jgi:light-regulated signal transduction histidine kinase (bacteriophytochrome)
MKQLIQDLLTYRGSAPSQGFQAGRAGAASRAIANLKAAIDESAAPSPTIRCPRCPPPDQLAQVFQNLIGNALKFRSQSAPKVHVAVQDRGEVYEIAVRDNGIGIEPQYFERIFMVFQRLHNKGEYPGTGIGLAIVKKVVERHGGSVRVESTPGEGSAFSFTLPKHQKETGNGG